MEMIASYLNLCKTQQLASLSAFVRLEESKHSLLTTIRSAKAPLFLVLLRPMLVDDGIGEFITLRPIIVDC